LAAIKSEEWLKVRQLILGERSVEGQEVIVDGVFISAALGLMAPNLSLGGDLPPLRACLTHCRWVSSSPKAIELLVKIGSVGQGISTADHNLEEAWAW